MDLQEAIRCPIGENAICVHPGHLRWMTRQENEACKK